MSRLSTRKNRINELLPRVAEVFGELGYRRATTASIAESCGVQETILYRLWDDKKAMFLAAIDHLFTWRISRIRSVLEKVPENENPLDHLVDDVAGTLGDHGLQRIIYAALGELGDPEIRDGLRDMYRHNYDVIFNLLDNSPEAQCPPPPASLEDAPWAIMGLVTMMDLTSELDLLGPRQRKQVFKRLARALLGLAAD